MKSTVNQVLSILKYASFRLGFLLLMVTAVGAVGQEDGEVAATPQPIYLPIKPAFVVNYGGEGRLRYIKAELTVRLTTSAAASGVRHHLPYIRNNLVRLFAGQTDETIESQEGKEALRTEALKEIQKIVMDEEGVDGVEEVLFTSLIIQK